MFLSFDFDYEFDTDFDFHFARELDKNYFDCDFDCASMSISTVVKMITTAHH